MDNQLSFLSWATTMAPGFFLSSVILPSLPDINQRSPLSSALAMCMGRASSVAPSWVISIRLSNDASNSRIFSLLSAMVPPRLEYRTLRRVLQLSPSPWRQAQGMNGYPLLCCSSGKDPRTMENLLGKIIHGPCEVVVRAVTARWPWHQSNAG